MPSGRTNNFPKSGRGLGHVTPTIFCSTVGYPSDSLASCTYLLTYLLTYLFTYNPMRRKHRVVYLRTCNLYMAHHPP